MVGFLGGNTLDPDLKFILCVFLSKTPGVNLKNCSNWKFFQYSKGSNVNNSSNNNKNKNGWEFKLLNEQIKFLLYKNSQKKILETKEGGRYENSSCSPKNTNNLGVTSISRISQIASLKSGV